MINLEELCRLQYRIPSILTLDSKRHRLLEMLPDRQLVLIPDMEIPSGEILEFPRRIQPRLEGDELNHIADFRLSRSSFLGRSIDKRQSLEDGMRGGGGGMYANVCAKEGEEVAFRRGGRRGGEESPSVAVADGPGDVVQG